jgi:hypothetical protein
MGKKSLVAREGAASRSIQGVEAARELFWQNVMREILTSLSVLCTMGRPESTELFDGRLAIITALGQRVPIASVFPLFACSIENGAGHRALSMAVECTVFQIRTPGGEVFTLPLHEMRGFHSLSEELIDQIRQQASQQSETDDDQEPFGFAAYTSLARTKLPGEALPGLVGEAELDDPEASPD